MQGAHFKRPLRILIVEDEPELLFTLTEWLQLRGFVVIEATSGREALRRITEQLHAIDLLITDLHMRDMSGLELTRRARALVPELKVIYMTGDDPETTLADPETVISKPFPLAELDLAISIVGLCA